MFRIGVVELILACGLFLLALIIPLIISRSYTRMDKRLKNIEKKINK